MEAQSHSDETAHLGVGRDERLGSGRHRFTAIDAQPARGSIAPFSECTGRRDAPYGWCKPGLDRFLRENRRSWESQGLPVIAALAAQGVGDWPAMAARLERVPGIAGVELHLNPTIRAAEAIRVTRAATELPILVKLDLDEAAEIAADCVAAGANCLVIARPPRGMMMVDGRAWYGRLYAPAVKPIILRVLAQVAELGLQVPLVACGGVHSGQDVVDFLGAGASAVEIDSAQWVEPQAAARIAAEVNELD